MSAGPEDETSKQMRRAHYEIGALWQRVRNLKRDKADTGHDHDGRYVNESGDSMTDALDFVGGSGPGRVRGATDSSRHFIVVEVEDSTGGQDSRLILYGSEDINGPLMRLIAANAQIDEDLDVLGSKNAQIDPEDPDNPNLRYRFAAVEADRPGVLEHEVELDTGTTYSLPPHWRRIATNLRCYLQPLSQGAVWPEIDTVNWTVTPRGQPSKVLALIRADRADVGVANWTHEVEVAPDEEGGDL